jgi:hypothetical protein
MQQLPTQDLTRIAPAESQILANPAPQEKTSPEPEILHQDSPQERAPILARRKPAIPLPDGLDEASLRDVQSWRDDCADADQEGQRVLYGHAFDHYSKWCVARGKKPVIKPAFGLAMKELGWPDADHKEAVEQGAVNYKAKVGGRFHLYGMILRRQGALKVVKSR